MERDDVIQELAEVRKDLLAFKRCRDDLYTRLRELDQNPKRRDMLNDWPVMKIVDNGLIMAIVRCEGLIEDYTKWLEQLDVPDNVLRLEKRNECGG